MACVILTESRYILFVFSSPGFICLFVVYVLIVIIGRYIYQKQRKARITPENDRSGEISEDSKFTSKA